MEECGRRAPTLGSIDGSPALQHSAHRIFSAAAGSGLGGRQARCGPGIPDTGMRAVNVVPEGTLTHQGLQQKASVRSVTQHQEMTSGYPGNRAPGPGAGLWLSLVPWGPAEAPAGHSSGSS